MNGQELSIASHSIARISFAKEPHVEQVSLPGSPPCCCHAVLLISGITHHPPTHQPPCPGGLSTPHPRHCRGLLVLGLRCHVVVRPLASGQ